MAIERQKEFNGPAYELGRVTNEVKTNHSYATADCFYSSAFPLIFP
jgi:hypothetical protein